MSFLSKINDIAAAISGKRYNDILKIWGEFTSFQLRTMSRTDYLEAYKGWVFRAVSTIASKTASLDFHIVDPKSGKQLDHEYLSLVKYDLIESVASFIKLNGSCFVWKNTIGGKVRSLHILRPDLVTFEYDSKWSRISAYKYQINGRTVRFKPEEIIPFHNFNPQQAFPFVTQGVGDVQAAAIAIDTDNAASVWNWKFFENNARPGMVLETDKSLTQEVKERLAEAWNSKFKGVNNANKLAILDGGLKANNINPSQKEMDFVEQRRFSRDEILGIFGVPKAVIGLGEGVNVGNVKAFNLIFAEQTVQPLAIKIQEALNACLFNGLGYFEFINVVPQDYEETRKDFDSGFMTVNEIRATRGLKPLKGGDVTKQDAMAAIAAPQVPAKSESRIHSKIVDIVRKSVKGTEEFNHERWKKRNARIVKYEPKISGILKGIFEKQEAEILATVKKGFKSDAPQIDQTKSQVLYLNLLKDAYVEFFGEEGQVAAEEVSAGFAFKVGDPEVTKLIRSSIRTLGKGIDSTTNEKIREAYAQAIEEGLGTSAIMERVGEVFAQLKEQRLETIVRTETVRVSNDASVQGWKQTGVVSAKQWWTAADERVSPFDKAMHGKIVSLETDFFKKGDVFEVDGQKLKIDYSDVHAPPLHPNCRCTLLPITD